MNIMPSYSHYGLISGILLKDFEKGDHPHLYLYIKNDTQNPFQIAVNVRDYDGSSVFFAHVKDLKAGFLKHLSTLSNGSYYLQPEDHADCLDYIKDTVIKNAKFSQIAEEELSNTILSLLKPYIDADNGSRVTAYGSHFPNGIHDIHMNQGYPDSSLPNTRAVIISHIDGYLKRVFGIIFNIKI
jgi:uncharacterized protein YukJ